MAVAATEDETGSRRDGRCSSPTQLEMNIFHRDKGGKKYNKIINKKRKKDV